MGSVCSCFQVPDCSNNRNCACLTLCIQNIMNKYRALFFLGGTPALPLSNHRATSPNSTVEPNNSSASTSRSQGRSFPNSASSRHLQRQQDVVVIRHEKGSAHSQVEPEPVEEGNVQGIPKLLGGGDKSVESYHDGGLKERCSESSVIILSAKGASVRYVHCSVEDEDVCPTCLEEYTPENPKITTECSHHYHLSCIYEWMERRNSCPVCGRLMVFDETT